MAPTDEEARKQLEAHDARLSGLEARMSRNERQLLEIQMENRKGQNAIMDRVSQILVLLQPTVTIP